MQFVFNQVSAKNPIGTIIGERDKYNIKNYCYNEN